MFLREDTGLNLTTLRERVDTGEAKSVRVKPDAVKFHLDADEPVIEFGRKTVPATDDNLAVVGDLLQVPTAFLKRMAKNTTSGTLNTVMGEMFANVVTDDVGVESVNNTLIEIAPWASKSKGIRPVAVVDSIAKALSDAPVPPKIARLVNTRGEFAFDAYADAASVKKSTWGIGGDPETILDDGTRRQVGDITSAGVRVGVNLKQGLAPYVQPYSHRLWCTNGCSSLHLGTKIDARGQSVEEVLLELEEMAKIAFEQAERDIEHYYDLRNQPVPNPERAIRTIARERNIPTRSTMALIDLAAGEDIPDSPTMFDVLNLVTNFANSPQVRNDGGRTLLEEAAGSVVTDHAARCGHCHQKVTSL